MTGSGTFTDPLEPLGNKLRPQLHLFQAPVNNTKVLEEQEEQKTTLILIILRCLTIGREESQTKASVS